MAKRNRQRISDRVIANAEVGDLLPAGSGQANIGAMSVGQQCAVVARAPSEKVEQPRAGLSAEEGFVMRTRVSVAPHCAAPFVVVQNIARLLVDFYFAKLRSRFRPLNGPSRAGRKIALVHAIPGFDSELGQKQKPKNGKKKCGRRKRESPRIFRCAGSRLVRILFTSQQPRQADAAQKDEDDNGVTGSVVPMLHLLDAASGGNPNEKERAAAIGHEGDARLLRPRVRTRFGTDNRFNSPKSRPIMIDV